MQIVRTIKLLCARTVELLYLEAEHDRLERIVKTDQVATGAFGAVAAETNCFYNRSSTYSARKAITGLIASRLYLVRSWDPVVLSGSILALAICALVASILPARRAASINPVIALRAE